MNKPYVKQYDDNGTLLNPIAGIYESGKSHRRTARRADFRRPFNNRKPPRVRVIGRYKFKEVVQHVDGQTIVHHLKAGA